MNGKQLSDLIEAADVVDPAERLMLADALEEAGRADEAATLRRLKSRAVRDGGEIMDGGPVLTAAEVAAGLGRISEALAEYAGQCGPDYSPSQVLPWGLSDGHWGEQYASPDDAVRGAEEYRDGMRQAEEYEAAMLAAEEAERERRYDAMGEGQS